MCAICILNYQVGDRVFALNCGHTFHVTCIEPWLEKNSVCPVCRFDLKLNLPASEAAKFKPAAPETVDLMGGSGSYGYDEDDENLM